jgi:gluconate kinase
VGSVPARATPRSGAKSGYLRGGRDLIAPHLAGRTGHFMRASLLQSQFYALEDRTRMKNL